jgi:hypothetical protein
MHSAGRVLAVVGIAAIALTCSDQTATGLRRAGHLAYLAITPVFSQAPQGGPSIRVKKIKGVLKSATGSDSIQTEALVQGDSAILEFDNVTVKGDSASFKLDVTALDSSDVVVFNGTQDLKVKPGANAPAAPQMNYTAPDATVTTVDITKGSASFTTDTLSWAGAATNDQTCLSRAPDATKITQRQLAIVGKNIASVVVPNTTVGWTSRDVTVATVSSAGLVKAQCSNKSTYIIARTFLDVVDSVKYVVNAPAFSLTMNPDSTSLERSKTQQLTAIVTDENGNTTPASTVTWSSSDATRATVNSSGLVTAIRNGRVLITAASGGRATIGVIQVVRPTASSVTVIPAKDTLGFGQVRQYYAKAIDALGQVIGDASGFTWSSSRTVTATVNATSGVAIANKTTADTTTLTATIDGKSGKVGLNVLALPPGTIKGIVKNGQTDVVLAGAIVTSSSGGSTTSAGDGSYTLTSVSPGDSITVSASTFVTAKFYDAPAFPTLTVTVPPLPLSPTSGSNGTISCKAINVLTNSAIANVTITAYAQLHSAPSASRPTVTAANTATTASDGSFSMVLPPGVYTLVGTALGYSDGIGTASSIGGTTKACSDLIMPPSSLGSGLYVVLTWSQPTTGVPANLDLVATGPKSTTDTSRFQINSTNRSFIATNGDTIAAVDIIASGASHGPEVIGLRPAAVPGFYNFYVNNVSANGVSNSELSTTAGARVDVYQDNHIIATFFPNSGSSGTVWQVFKYDGTRIFPGGGVTTAGTSYPLGVTLRLPDWPAATPLAVPIRRR